MSSAQSAEWSRNLAVDLGERRGRTVSRVLGDGLRSISNPKMGQEESVDRVHAGMALAAIGLVAIPNDRVRIGIFVLLVGAALWNHGKRNSPPPPPSHPTHPVVPLEHMFGLRPPRKLIVAGAH